jgi:O-6-methylguanine DNA methyltransferase
MLYAHVYFSDFGWIGLLSSDTGLIRTTLPQISKQSAQKKLEIDFSLVSFSGLPFQEVIKFFDDYFNRKSPCFSGRMDINNYRPFQKSVWDATFRIPYGETRSYAQIAQIVNHPLACRAVGNALGKNPLPIIIPCHRVITGDGSLGGFSGDLKMKSILLEHEGNVLKS